MWIKRQRYEALIDSTARSEERAEWLRLRVNQLEQERAELMSRVSGRPQRVMTVDRPRDPDAFKDFPAGTVDFNDMGDQTARDLGIEWDDNGRVSA